MHGGTMTTQISFRDVAAAIARYSFPPRRVKSARTGAWHAQVGDERLVGISPYPVILSLEMHCSVGQQQVLAQILRDELGPLLALPDDLACGWLDPATGRHDTLLPPSPEQLRCAA
jgi:phosphatidylinositol phospholipase C delta